MRCERGRARGNHVFVCGGVLVSVCERVLCPWIRPECCTFSRHSSLALDLFVLGVQSIGKLHIRTRRRRIQFTDVIRVEEEESHQQQRTPIHKKQIPHTYTYTYTYTYTAAAVSSSSMKRQYWRGEIADSGRGVGKGEGGGDETLFRPPIRPLDTLSVT